MFEINIRSKQNPKDITREKRSFMNCKTSYKENNALTKVITYMLSSFCLPSAAKSAVCNQVP